MNMEAGNDAKAGASDSSPIVVQQGSDSSTRQKQIGIGVGVPMLFIVVGLIIFTYWYRRRRRYGSTVREMVDDAEKQPSGADAGSDSDNNSLRDMKELESRRPGTSQALPQRQHSIRRAESRGGRDRYQRPATSQGISFSDRYNSIAPPKRNEVSLVERLTRSLSQNGQPARKLHKARPSDDLLRPHTATRRPHTAVARQISATTKTPTIKQTRFDIPPSPTASNHKRSASEPLQSLIRPRTAPEAYTSPRWQQKEEQSTSPPPSWSPPHIDLSNRPFTPVSIMPESSFSRPHKGSYALPAAFISGNDMGYRPQTPGYEVHTELWRQQQQNWIQEERRQIKAEYERLMKQRQTEQELQRLNTARSDMSRADAADAGRWRRSPLLVRRERTDGELDRELGLSGLRRGYGIR